MCRLLLGLALLLITAACGSETSASVRNHGEHVISVTIYDSNREYPVTFAKVQPGGASELTEFTWPADGYANAILEMHGEVEDERIMLVEHEHNEIQVFSDGTKPVVLQR